jgi:hypothetical protein
MASERPNVGHDRCRIPPTEEWRRPRFVLSRLPQWNETGHPRRCGARHQRRARIRSRAGAALNRARLPQSLADATLWRRRGAHWSSSRPALSSRASLPLRRARHLLAGRLPASAAGLNIVARSGKQCHATRINDAAPAPQHGRCRHDCRMSPKEQRAAGIDVTLPRDGARGSAGANLAPLRFGNYRDGGGAAGGCSAR